MTVQHQYISLDKPTEWRQALSGIRHSFGHTWESCYAMHLTTGLKTYLYCFESDQGRAVCPICEREYQGTIDLVKPFGFSGFVGTGDCTGLDSYWKESARERGYVCGFLGLNPLFDFSSHFDAAEVQQYDTIHVFDLTLTMEQLFSNLHRSRQRELKGWDSQNPAFTCDVAALKAFFLEQYTDFLQARHAESFYFFSDETLLCLMNLENIKLVGAQTNGKVVAVMVFVYTPHTADALFTLSLPAGRSYTIPLIWYGVNHFKSLQIPNLNLGGGGGGVGESKRRYGCDVYPLSCLKQVYQPEIYENLCQQAGVEQDSSCGYFPAYRKPA